MRITRTNRIQLGLFLVLGIILFVLFLLWLQSSEHGESEQSKSNSSTPTPEKSENVTAVSTAIEQEHTDSTDRPHVSELWSVCQVENWETVLDFVGEASAQCLELFEEYFLDKQIVARRIEWIHFPSPLTFRRAFENPERDVALVLSALRDSECRFNQEQLFDWDLKEKCRAGAFANLALVTKECTKDHQAATIRLIHDVSQAHRVGSISSKWSKLVKQSTFESYQGSKLSNRFCSELNLTGILLSAERSPLEYQKLLDLGSQLGYHPEEVIDFRLGILLESIAARFGDSSAIASLHDPDSRVKGSGNHTNWYAHLDSEQPWRVHFRRMNDFDELSVDKLDATLDLILALQDANLEFDWGHLVRDMCSTNRSGQTDVPTCQMVIQKLEQHLDLGEDRKSHALDKFKRTAIKSHTYDRIPREIFLQ